MIGNERVDTKIHNGTINRTNVSDDFERCDFDKVYNLVT